MTAVHAMLTLDSDLADMGRLPAWIESVADASAIPADSRFAIQLALEEAVSNVIRHGYENRPGSSVAITFSNPQPGEFFFQIDDRAPHLNPLDLPPLPAISLLETAQIGGQGLRLMREFTSSLAYEALPGGNRLTLGFTAAS